MPGCQGKSGAQAGGSAPGGGSAKDRTATILTGKATLWTESDGVMKPKATANLGDVVAWKDSMKNAVRSTDKAERRFAKIESDKETLWIQDVFVAADSIPGVIVGDEVVLYKKPDVAAPSGTTIPKDTIVGVHSDKTEGGFIPISAYVDGAKSPVVTRMYVKADYVTVVDIDVKAMKLISLAKAEKNEVVKKELLRNAESLRSSYGDVISAELKAMEPKEEEFFADDSDVVIEAEVSALEEAAALGTP